MILLYAQLFWDIKNNKGLLYTIFFVFYYGVLKINHNENTKFIEVSSIIIFLQVTQCTKQSIGTGSTKIGIKVELIPLKILRNTFGISSNAQ